VRASKRNLELSSGMANNITIHYLPGKSRLKE
jgi:hypothetical protein